MVTVRTLDIDTPLRGIQVKCLQGPLLAEALGLVDELVATVVSCTGVALRVLVYKAPSATVGRFEVQAGRHTLHNTAEGIENSLRSEVLRRNEVDEMLLPVFLLSSTGKSAVGSRSEGEEIGGGPSQ